MADPIAALRQGCGTDISGRPAGSGAEGSVHGLGGVACTGSDVGASQRVCTFRPTRLAAL